MKVKEWGQDAFYVSCRLEGRAQPIEIRSRVVRFGEHTRQLARAVDVDDSTWFFDDGDTVLELAKRDRDEHSIVWRRVFADQQEERTGFRAKIADLPDTQQEHARLQVKRAL